MGAGELAGVLGLPEGPDSSVFISVPKSGLDGEGKGHTGAGSGLETTDRRHRKLSLNLAEFCWKTSQGYIGVC